MRRMHPLGASALFTLGLGCSSATPPPESPAVEPAAVAAESPAAESPAEEAALAEEPEPEPPPKAVSTADSIPDDYFLTRGDCAALGKHFGAVTRSDQAEQLSPKLKEKQREQAMASIERAAVKLETQWIESCDKTLVGKTADPKSLQCALRARTVKEFDVCLNGPPK